MAIVTAIETPPGSRRRLRLSNPATGNDLGEIEVQNAHDVATALEAARKAQPEWAARSVEERARYLTRALRTLLDRQDEFIDVMLRESGKPRAQNHHACFQSLFLKPGIDPRLSETAFINLPAFPNAAPDTNESGGAIPIGLQLAAPVGRFKFGRTHVQPGIAPIPLQPIPP